MVRVVEVRRIDVILSTHASYDGSLERIPELATRPQGDPNPCVVGSERVGRAVKVIGEYARGFLTTLDAAQESAGSVWRLSARSAEGRL